MSCVTAHVTQGGGSFGRHLFADAAFEAAAISKAIGKPVKLMWHRTDNFRQGRVHPMCTSRVRITYLGNDVLTFDQRHTSVATDFTHGLGEILSATLGRPARGRLSRLFAERVHAHRQRALQLRAGHAAPERGLPPAGQRVQHLERAQHLQPGGDRRQGADGRPGRESDGAGPVPVPALVRAGPPHARGAGRGGQGSQLGQARWRRSPPRESASTASTRATPRAWPRSTARRRPSTGRSRTDIRARGSPRSPTPSTLACRSTRSGSRPR